MFAGVRFAAAVFIFASFCCELAAAALSVLLFVPGVSPSHLRFSATLAEILHRHGHVVDKVVLALHPSIKIYGTEFLRHSHRVEVNDSVNPYLKIKHFKNPFDTNDHAFFQSNAQIFTEMNGLFCEALVADEALMARLRAADYDAAVISSYSACGHALARVLGVGGVVGYVPTAGTEDVPELLGIPMPPSFVTDLFSPVERRLDFFGRVGNFLSVVGGKVKVDLYASEQSVIAKHYPNLAPLRTLVGQMSYFMVNTDELIDVVRPISPKVKYIGAISDSKTPTPLGGELEKALNVGSRRGVVVMSFGSLVNTAQIPLPTKVAIIEAFCAFPEWTFVWKYDTIDADAPLFANATNIHLTAWLPQIALLKDRRVKAFITHMGQNSYYELSVAGVPAIAIPILADQYYNAGAALINGVAVRLDKLALSAHSITHALREVLEKPSYAANAKEIARMLALKPEKIGAAEFARYVEYAAAFPRLGNDTLQMASTELSLIQLYSIDVIAFLGVCGLLAAVLLLSILRAVLRLAANPSNPKKKAQ